MEPTTDHQAPATDPVRLRSPVPKDVAAVMALSAQLGYLGEEAAFRDRLARLAGRPDHLIIVAEGAGGALLGWAHAMVQDAVEAGPWCEILGLVVDEAARGRGIGRRMVAEVEAWARSRGLRRIVVRSNVVREASHPFYAGLGFARRKTQHVYELPTEP